MPGLYNYRLETMRFDRVCSDSIARRYASLGHSVTCRQLRLFGNWKEEEEH